MILRLLQALLAVAAAAGFVFSSVSTSDFTAHLDRQVHGIHCSFVPGADTPDVSGTSGCHATLMSPYSSVMRDTVWGGIPVSLPSMAVFAYLFVCALGLVAVRRESDARASGYQALAWALPFLTSLAFGYLSLHELDAACKLCIGIYSASTVGFVLAVGTFFVARSAAPLASGGNLRREASEEDHPSSSSELDALGVAETHLDERVVDARVDRAAGRGETEPADATLAEGAADATEREAPRRKIKLATASDMDRRLLAEGGMNRRRLGRPSTATAPVGFGVLALAFVLGVLFVAAPVVSYAAQAPDFERFVGACGTLAHPEDEGRVLVPIGAQTRSVTMLEVLDPLCPSCRGFERRFSAHPAAAQVSRRVLLFPLDAECNRMLDTSLHPGACAISEAVLCAEDDAEEVLDWAFEHQEEIRERETASAGAARHMAEERFPSLRACLGSDAVRAELNRSLRWAVLNQLPILTPQVYVENTRICDEDTDLGLDYVLTRLLSGAGRTSSVAGAR